MKAICRLCKNLRWLDLGSHLSENKVGSIFSRNPLPFLEVLALPRYHIHGLSEEALPKLRLLILSRNGVQNFESSVKGTGRSLPYVRNLMENAKKGYKSGLLRTLSTVERWHSNSLMSILSSVVFFANGSCSLIDCVLYLSLLVLIFLLQL